MPKHSSIKKDFQEFLQETLISLPHLSRFHLHQ
uniref:Uncharacterized protein n=1 Tax=Anguilla anguilla TaxID=7936 RepID=A0A0E9TN91_ANGAN